MAQMNSSKSEQERVKTLFLTLDQSKDGFLSFEELSKGLGAIFGTLKAEEAIQLVLSMDSNSDGKIDYAEFQTAVMMLNVNKQKTYLQTTFKLFDANNDGSISLDELRACFGNQGGLSEILAEADVDKDGVISFDEFYEIMIK